DDPEETPPQHFRIDICAATTRGVPPNSAGVVEKLIPAGRYAALRHVGSDDGLGASLKYLYGRWLPCSGERLRNFPLCLKRVRFFPDVPEREAVTDILLPLQP